MLNSCLIVIAVHLMHWTEFWTQENIDNFMSRGVAFLCQLLSVSSTARVASILQDKLSYGVCWLTHTLEEESYDSVYETDAFVAAENGEQELIFEDDRLVHGPNAAWPWSTKRKTYMRYFEKDKESLRRWAYVMWDIGRLQGWGVSEVNPGQLCETFHCREDTAR